MGYLRAVPGCTDGVKSCQCFCAQGDVRCADVLLEMCDRPRSGDQQGVRRVRQQPRQSDLGWGGIDFGRDLLYRRVIGDIGETGERRSEGEVRHPGDALGDAEIEYLFVAAVEEAVGVLHADNSRRHRPPHDFERHAADADRTDLALIAQRDHLGQLVVEIDDLVALGLQARTKVEAPQVHHRNAIESQLTQIVFDGGAQLGGFLRCLQRSSALVDSLRADARRNRERLLEVAAAAFGAADGSQVSLEAIARDARVGIGTLYRHFPSRDLLVEAVYRAELAEVAAAAAQLLEGHPPKVALRRWMDRYASFVAAKRGMAESLRAMVDSGAVQINQTHARIVGAVEMLLRAGVDDGCLRSDVLADDVVSSLLGIFMASGSPDQTGRMLDLLVAGVAVPGRA